MRKIHFRVLLAITLIVAFSIGIGSVVFAQDPPEINWIEGPKTVDLGAVAQVTLDNTMIFADGSDTRKILKYIGDPTDNSEIGLIAPNSEYFDWTLQFNYYAVGYIKDDEKSSLDSNEILNSIKDATDEANKVRIKNGFSAINVIGWNEEPHYDSNTHNLTWAVLGEDANDKTRLVNYNTRLLGRGGYISANLITSPEYLATYKPTLNTILANFSWKSGKSYAEWKPGDKVAQIGLTALIAGGAGAVAAKTGLLGKIWYFIVLGVGAVIAFFRKLFRRIFRRNEKPVSYDNIDSNNQT
jgi:uncharacterized membrane-anchored protein